jgi:hypothetical protein
MDFLDKILAAYNVSVYPTIWIAQFLLCESFKILLYITGTVHYTRKRKTYVKTRRSRSHDKEDIGI